MIHVCTSIQYIKICINRISVYKQQKKEKKETKADNTNQAITIKHAEGETKLDKSAKKVVVLEWGYSEDLLALGVSASMDGRH